MNYADILKWAAGVEIEIDPREKYDVKVLMNLIDLHNLSGRFLNRIEKENPDWVTTSLVKELKLLYTITKRKVSRNIKALSGLQRSLVGSQVVVIKGVSSYILCGKKEIMRAGDIDILSNNVSEVIDTLTDWGYKSTKAPFMHEIGEYSKRGIEFDIHEYFPVYSYPQKLKNTRLSNTHRGVVENDYSFTSKRIVFNDFFKYVESDKKPSIVNVTDPNLLIIVICAHAFMNYTNVWSISHRKKAYVRLSEIADVISLTEHPDFRSDKFLRYMMRFDARDSVEWFATVSQALYGKNLLPVKIVNYNKRAISGRRFPRCLWWNFWTDIPEDFDDMLFPNWMSMRKVIKNMASNTISLNTNLGVDRIKNHLSKNGRLIDANIHFELRGKSFVVRIGLEKLENSSTDRIRVDFGKYALEWEFNNKTGVVKITGDGQILESHSDKGMARNISFKINLDKLDCLKNENLPMLIGIARHNSIGKIVARKLFPIQVNI